VKRTFPSRALLFAACALLLPNTVVSAQTAQVITVEAKRAKEEAVVNQQLKDLVKKRRTRKGWLGDGTVPANVRVVKDVTYVDKSVSASQKLDLYIPTTTTKTRWPLVVWIHGGGWKGGDKKGGPFYPLLENGFAVASINYRLSDESKWPAQFDDCQSALTFLRKHAAEYNIDTKRMGLWGGSAGGHLVLMLALRDKNPSDKLIAVCDWFGPTDLTRFLLKGETTKMGEDLIRDLFGLQGEALIAACPSASPVTYISDAKYVPPILIMHGRFDKLVSIRQSQHFVEKMKEAGFNDVRLEEINGAHGYPGFGESTVNNVVKFFKQRMLKNESLKKRSHRWTKSHQELN
jgi:acetyl esterase/lipase